MKTLPKTKSLFILKTDFMRKTIFQAILLLFSLSAYSIEKPFNTEKPEWNTVQKDNEIELYDRWIVLPDGRKTRERKGVLYVDNSIDEILEFVSTAEGVKRWMSGVEESKDVNENIIYVLFNVPWPFKDKDLVASVAITNMPETKGKKIQYSAIADYLPAKEGAERLLSYEATWLITETEPGRTQIVFAAYSDTPPVAPKWIQDPITAKLFKDNLLRLRELLIELEYENLNAQNR
jgi:hypothetical protein